MVGVAQLVEHPVVVRDVAGSSPVAHPIFSKYDQRKFIASMSLESLIEYAYKRGIRAPSEKYRNFED